MLGRAKEEVERKRKLRTEREGGRVDACRRGGGGEGGCCQNSFC